MQTKVLSRYEESIERVNGLCIVFSRANTTLAGVPIKCYASKMGNNGIPSSTDGTSVWFNIDEIALDGSLDDLILVNGLNYHELSHILFSPSMQSSLVLRVRRIGNGMMAFNILEDQRIERRMIALYPATKPYFVSLVVQQLLRDPAKLVDRHILIHGRRYLPTEVRDVCRDNFAHKAVMAEIESVIDAYLSVEPLDSKQEERVVALVTRFAKAIASIQPQATCDTLDGYKPRAVPQRRPAPSEEQLDEADKPYGSSDVDEDDADDTDESDDNGGAGGGDEADTDNEADDTDGADGGSGEDPKDGESEEGSSQSGDADSNDDSDMDGDTDGGEGDDSDGEGAGEGAGRTTLDILKQAMEQVQRDDRVREDANNVDHTLKREGASRESTLPSIGAHYRNNTAQVESKSVASSRLLARHFDRLRHELDPGWERQTSSGRLNIARAMNDDNDYDTLWDRWEEGHTDAMDIEAIIAVDRSGSMHRHDWDAINAAWAIGHALQQVDADVSIMAFDGTGYDVYRRDERLEADRVRQVGAAGGTDPTDVINEARRRFHYSTRAVKYFFIVTDGDWSNHSRCVGYLKQMTDAGIITAVVGIGGFDLVQRNEKNPYHVNFVTNMPDIAELPMFARQVVTLTVRRMGGVRR